MIHKFLILFLIVFCTCYTTVSADSPLTSTDFSIAYLDEPIVIKAGEAEGILSHELMNFLSDEKNAIDIKMAVINKLSWSIDGKSNSAIYFDYLKKLRGYKNESDFIKKGKGDDLLCMAYLKALDNYFDVSDAVKYADAALKKNKKSYTVNIVVALIKAQKEFDKNWCNVFKMTDNVRKNNSLKIDMREEAMEIIFQYMDIYSSECN